MRERGQVMAGLLCHPHKSVVILKPNGATIHASLSRLEHSYLLWIRITRHRPAGMLNPHVWKATLRMKSMRCFAH